MLFLLVEQAHDVDWPEVGHAVRDYRWPRLHAAGALAVASYAVYSTYDLVARHHSGHRLGSAAVLGMAFVSYCGNLNFGAWFGGIGMRLRLYTRQGLSAATLAEIFGLSLLTNRLGYAVLADVLLVWRPLALPADWALGQAGLRASGGAMLLVAALHLAACAFTQLAPHVALARPRAAPVDRFAGLGSTRAVCEQLVADRGAGFRAAAGRGALHRRAERAAGRGSGRRDCAHAGRPGRARSGFHLALLGQRLAASEILGAILVYRLIYYLLLSARRPARPDADADA